MVEFGKRGSKTCTSSSPEFNSMHLSTTTKCPPPPSQPILAQTGLNASSSFSISLKRNRRVTIFLSLFTLSRAVCSSAAWLQATSPPQQLLLSTSCATLHCVADDAGLKNLSTLTDTAAQHHWSI